MSGNDGEEVTPVPIPNTEVKFFSADGSRGLPPVRVGRCRAIYKASRGFHSLARFFVVVNSSLSVKRRLDGVLLGETYCRWWVA